MEKTAIKRVIYSDPVTTIIWDDGSKTQSRCDERDNFDELTGFMMCVFKKIMKHKDMRQMFDTFVYGDDKHYVKRDKVKQTNNVKKTNNFKKTNNTDWLTDILKGLEDYTTLEDCIYDTKHIDNTMFDDIINDMTIIFKE
jgi:hypothetical protein